jgi:hypothetical protein
MCYIVRGADIMIFYVRVTDTLVNLSENADDALISGSHVYA